MLPPYPQWPGTPQSGSPRDGYDPLGPPIFRKRALPCSTFFLAWFLSSFLSHFRPEMEPKSFIFLPFSLLLPSLLFVPFSITFSSQIRLKCFFARSYRIFFFHELSCVLPYELDVALFSQQAVRREYPPGYSLFFNAKSV